MSAIAVIGTGYVGLTTAVCLAKLGHRVVGVDIDEAKVARLRSGVATIYEPGLEELMQETQKSGRLVFTSDYREGIPAPTSSSSPWVRPPVGGVRRTSSTSSRRPKASLAR